jgi:hypothetical protein
MTEAKFTPGPWEACYDEDDGRHIISMADAITSPGNHLSHHRIEYDHGLYEDEDAPGTPGHDQFLQAEANADLIAAAPDLYEALDELQRLSADIRAVAQNERFGALRMKALRALAKARGEQS